MNSYRIALAALPYPATPADALRRVVAAIDDAKAAQAQLLCFPEAYIPGYRWPGRPSLPADPAFLAHAHEQVAAAAGAARLTVVLGTERFAGQAVRLTALVALFDGSIAGYQDKVQLDPSEDAFYEAGTDRMLFRSGPLQFGICICHEGFRYPETVRWAARRGAQLVLHPHYSEPEPGHHVPQGYADRENSFHEKATLCRAAENDCYFATVNCAVQHSPTTSAVVNPDGSLLCHQPHGEAGLLVADLDLQKATRTLAQRYRGGADLP